MAQLLLIEDDIALAETTCEYLENFGFSVRHAADGQAGLDAVEAQLPELILLDLMLPHVDGLEICRRLRADDETKSVPILMLTARDDETDRVVGLELGADDYLSKPYSLRELVARIRAILRRVEMMQSETLDAPKDAPVPSEDIIHFEHLTINRLSRFVELYEQSIEFTATEFELLWLLATRPGQVLSREQLLDQVRGREFEVFDRSIDVHISKLRKKLEKNPKQPTLIKTVWGVGYRFEPETLKEES
ncbi:MAG: DNA-binding response regulator [Deltaproteobacteria bacterium]|nr:DNA-binding response regulator [Deltaproteobacteria bacterium]MBU48606.1 DNA-binding response regulator [Deltaproteobacteria bacterium]|tara:strand:- start:9665 stop:10408 length:744 start_codon:yes stop_codon:yes gene_type:complete